MNNPLVSVLITIYNREKYIATAIESVLAQSMSDFELIVVDDGSTDSSLEIAKRYEKDPRVKIYPNEHNLGQFPTRNRAASLAKGKYLKYVDSDDAIYPHCLEVMTHMMERHPNAGMLLCTWSDSDPYYPFELSSLEAYRRCFLHDERMSTSPLNTMFRRAAFESIGGFHNTKWPLSGDWDMVLKAARKFSVLFAPIGMTFYRVHEGQVITSQTKLINNFTSEGLAISLDALRHSGCPLTDTEKKWVLGRLLRGIVFFSCSLAFKRMYPLAAYQLLASYQIRLEEWKNIFNFKKPSMKRPEIGNEPDWNDFPGARTDRSNNIAKPSPAKVDTSLIIAGNGDVATWERTIRSALVQLEEDLEVIIVSSLHCSNPPLDLVKIYPFVRLLSFNEENIWNARNQAAKDSHGKYLKFIEPGTLFYPYAFKITSQSVGINDNVDVVLEGNTGCSLPLPWYYDPVGAMEQGLIARASLFDIPLVCALIRRETFLNLDGFDVKWQEWSPFELFFRLALRSGCVVGLRGLNNKWHHRIVDVNRIPLAFRRHMSEYIRSFAKHEKGFDDNRMENIVRFLDSQMPLCSDVKSYPTCPDGLFPWTHLFGKKNKEN